MPLRPTIRRLKVFSLDPSADIQLDTALVSRSVLEIPWEDGLEPGPSGEYVEVIDVDPASDLVYAPIDLNEPSLLATDGLEPSTGNPQFHQQMVYAVAMRTITNFERALGRKVLWAEREFGKPQERYVQKLRIYPHALREQNAYYSPSKKALLFGYFDSPTSDPRDELPGGTVFTCLSHDIIAHETTHAILDGMHRYLLDSSNPDMLAFHEAFADIVAIFQHFTLPGLLLDQIEKTRGDLATNNLLAKLAVQFARSTGRGESLRNALGFISDEGKRQPPDPSAFSSTFEPHARGAILVAAIFDAFLNIYQARIRDLQRIATNGTGVLPDGAIHPDLANRFADEALQTADRVLTMCIRAIDYLPPVDVTFGDYLRALITADVDFNPNDEQRHRLAFIQAFRDRGIYPLDVRTLAVDTLCWDPVSHESTEWQEIQSFVPSPSLLRTMAYAHDASVPCFQKLLNTESPFLNCTDDEEIRSACSEFLKEVWGNVCCSEQMRTLSKEGKVFAKQPLAERENRFVLEKCFADILFHWIYHHSRSIYNIEPNDVDLLSENETEKGNRHIVSRNLGIDLYGIVSEEASKQVEVHAVRPTIRLRPDGYSKVELLIILTQQQPVKMKDPDGNNLKDHAGNDLEYFYRGGCTLILDPDRGRLVYAISKDVRSLRRRQRHEAFLKHRLAHEGEAALEAYGLHVADQCGDQCHREPLAAAHIQPGLSGGY